MFQKEAEEKIESVERDRTQMTIWRISIECLTITATDTHSEYIIIIAFPRQQLLHEPASILHLYVLCLSCFVNNETLKGEFTPVTQIPTTRDTRRKFWAFHTEVNETDLTHRPLSHRPLYVSL